MRSQSIFSNIWIIGIALVLLATYSYSIDTTWEERSYSAYLIKFMMIYLYFIAARTVILLSLSFYERLVKRSILELSHFPLVTIIIPCFNEELVIEESIRSVELIEYSNLEILVVDDGSTDETFSKAKKMELEGRVRVITKTNGGKASSLNAGINEALGDYILCMDADSKIEKSAIKNALPYFAEFPSISAVAGNVRVGNANTPLTLFQKLEYVVGLNFHKMAQSALNCVTIIPGPVGLFKKSALLEVGGYDVDTFAEDCDLTLKLLSSGHQVKYNSDVIALTEAPTSVYQLMMQRYRWSRGTIQAIVKNTAAFLSGPGKSKKSIIFLYIILETMVIPTINFLFFMITIAVALHYDIDGIYGPFFLGLTLMDATIALYSIFMEKEVKMMFFLSIVGRITYGLALETSRFFAMIDELLKIPMKWGEQKREGMK